MPTDTNRKPERAWRRTTVDANLRDEWLEQLNSMRALELRSICEGHIASVDELCRNAGITARVRDDLEPFFHRHWHELEEPISRMLEAAFCRDDARIRVEATRELTLNPGGRVRTRQALFIWAAKRHARKRREIDPETLVWLENAVAAFMALDAGFLALYERRAPEA
jgi:hypothetical protein